LNTIEISTETIIDKLTTSNPQFIIGKIVSKYKTYTDEAEKQVLRNQFHVTNYKKCIYADLTL